MTTRGNSTAGGHQLAELGVDLQDGAGDGCADARLVEHGLRQRHVRAGGDQPGLQGVRRRHATLVLGGGESRLLLTQPVVGIGEPPAGVRQRVRVAGILAIGGKRVVELEAGAGDGTLGREHCILGLADALAAGGYGDGVAILLGGCRLGFGSGEAGARLLVLDADQHLALGDLVVHDHGHRFHLAGKAGADADQARAGLDAPWRRSHPLLLHGGSGIRAVAPGSRHLDLQRIVAGEDDREGKAGQAQRPEPGDDCDFPGHSTPLRDARHLLICRHGIACRSHGFVLTLWTGLRRSTRRRRRLRNHRQTPRRPAVSRGTRGVVGDEFAPPGRAPQSAGSGTLIGRRTDRSATAAATGG